MYKSQGTPDERLQRLVREQAKRLGITEQEVLESFEDRLTSLDAAHAIAALRGASADQLVTDLLARAGAYPTPDCLDLTDVEEYVEGSRMPPELEAHVKTCEGCQELLALSEPPDPLEEAFAQEVRELDSIHRLLAGATSTVLSTPVRFAPPTEATAAVAQGAVEEEPSVLVVDDEKESLEYISRWLEEMRFRVIVAPTSREALKLIRSQTPDVVLTDILMPGASGVEILRATHRQDPGIPVIMMYARELAETAAKVAGPDVFGILEKPVLQAVLASLCKRAVEFHDLQRENALLRRRVLAL